MFALLLQFFILSANIGPVLAVLAAIDITVAGPRDTILPPAVQSEDVIWHTIDIFDHKNGTVVPEEMEAVLNSTHYLKKRQALPPYQCPPRYQFDSAECQDNAILTTCILANGNPYLPLIKSHTNDCMDLLCIPRYLGNNPPKSACVSISRLVHGSIPAGGSKSCSGLNVAGYQGKSVHVATRFAAGFHPFKAYTPNQVSLLDGSNNLIQSVGSADMRGGNLISTIFKYIGGVQECVTSFYGAPVIDFYSAIIAV